MTFYQTQIERIRKECFANETQVQAVLRARQHMEQHYHSAVTLDALARIGFTSRFHLIRLFRKYYGMTPQQYLTDLRIQHSAALLRKGMPVKEVCYAVGFECPASFSTLFKKKTGYAPVAFQKQATFAK